MPSFVDAANGVGADASFIQQIIDAAKGTAGKGIPFSLTAVNDAVNFALAVKNNDAGASKALVVYKADGTVLLQVDKNGVIASPDGVLGAGQIATLTAAQTLTNKTLTSPHMASPVVDSGGLTVTAGGIDVTGASTIRSALHVGSGLAAPGTGLQLAGATPVAQAGTFGFGVTLDGLGGGATATLGTIGGTGPVTAAQNNWWRINIAGANRWIPYWA